MGCCSSSARQAKIGRPQPQQKEEENEPEQSQTIIREDDQSKPLGKAEVYGCYPSMNCMGPVMLASFSRCGKMVETFPPEGTNTTEFLKMNPFHGVPMLKDEDLVIAESNAILRYMAQRYAPQLYPKEDQRRLAFIDWAMDRFANVLYKDVYKTIYPCLGFADAPEDPDAAGKTASYNLHQFAEVFLKERFIGGSQISIADYKVVPFFFAYVHPMLKERCSIEVPERISDYVTDLLDECPPTVLLYSPEGSLKRLLDTKYGQIAELHPTRREAAQFPFSAVARTSADKSKVKILGIPTSMNCASVLLLGKHAGIGEMEKCMPGEATRSEEHMKMNPHGGVPVLKDGDFCLAESSAILRYLARAYAPELYPEDLARRAHVDWALDRFSFGLYNDCVKTIYAAAGFRVPEASEDLPAAGKVASDNLAQFATVFLKEKFIGGDRLSIADFKVAPFFAAYSHEVVRQKCLLQVPDRILQFNTEFAEACTGSDLLRAAGGCSILELLDSKTKAEDAKHREEAIVPREEELELQEAMVEEANKLVAGPPEPVIGPPGPVLDDPPAPCFKCGCC